MEIETATYIHTYIHTCKHTYIYAYITAHVLSHSRTQLKYSDVIDSFSKTC